MTSDRSSDARSDAECALSRFGMGARPGDLARIASDPRGALKQEIKTRDVALLKAPELETSQQIARALAEGRVIRSVRDGRKLNEGQRALAAELREKGELPDNDRAMGGGRDMGGGKDMGGRQTLEERRPPVVRRAYRLEVAARMERIGVCDIGFAERLTLFWSNHFAISAVKARIVAATSGAYEREAIRPHVLGRFSDLLSAATKHPTMLRYLDNAASFGPNSRIGQRRRRGLNENHARELLELHTVGVRGGYTQADVIALAKAMTGWTVVTSPDAADVGAYRYDDRRHEPGDQIIMGKRYRDDGEGQAQAVLDDLARHPATARNVAQKLATAFVADAPPPALVDKLAKTFRDTDGDLMQVSLALVDADEAWSAPRTKMRSPQEFVFAMARGFDRRQDEGDLMKGFVSLGQPFWSPPSPKGYSLIGADWIAPDAQTNRLDLASDLAERFAHDSDPNALADRLLGPVLTDETRTAVKRAGSREQALALLMMSPEMQRR